jgi:hypothetical protein
MVNYFISEVGHHPFELPLVVLNLDFTLLKLLQLRLFSSKLEKFSWLKILLFTCQLNILADFLTDLLLLFDNFFRNKVSLHALIWFYLNFKQAICLSLLGFFLQYTFNFLHQFAENFRSNFFELLSNILFYHFDFQTFKNLVWVGILRWLPSFKKMIWLAQSINVLLGRHSFDDAHRGRFQWLSTYD